jgi:alkanesulfonate monooxygenase SsuD/methylene tetrahydromethanopterin reductase-like flavin-dependent oxidoreductase (luciferase family)
MPPTAIPEQVGVGSSVPMDLGFHIADFTWNGGRPELAPTLGRLAREAEAGGIARLTVMDHFWQIGPVGAPEESMLEAYTTLGYLAAVTERVLLHTLVTGVVYREPGFLAKVISTLDVLSGGRAGLGIGAAWFQEEAEGLGFAFPPLGERFERLEEHCRSVCRCGARTRVLSRGATIGCDGHSTRRHRLVDPTRSSSSAAAESARPYASWPSTPTPATSSSAATRPVTSSMSCARTARRWGATTTRSRRRR